MFKIKINGQSVDFFPDTKIRLRFNNPAFSDEVQEGSYSLPFSLPSSPTNQNIFGHINLFSSRSQTVSFDCHFFIYDILFCNAVMYLTGADELEYQADLALDIGRFVNKIGEYKINSPELNHSTYTLPRSPNYDFALIKLLESDFLNPDLYEVNLRCAQMDSTYTNVQTQTVPVRYTNETSPEQVISELASVIGVTFPFLYFATSGGFNFVLERFWLNPSGNLYFSIFFENKEIETSTITTVQKNLEIKSTQFIDLDASYSDFVFPRIYNRDFYDSKNDEFLDNVNYWKDAGILAFSLDMQHNISQNLYNIVPFIKLNYVFQKIENFSGFLLNGSFRNDFELQNLILYNNYALDKASNFSDDINGYDEQIDYKNHLPEVRIKDFLIQLAKKFGFYYSFSLRKKEGKLIYKNELLDAEVIDITSKILKKYNIKLQSAESTKVYFSENLNEPVPEYFYNDVPQNSYAPEFNSLKVGNYEAESGYPIGVGSLPTSEIWGIPTIAEKGNSSMFGLGTKNKFQFRLLFWRGLRLYDYADISGNGFNTSKTYIASSQATEFDNYALTIDGPKGLYNTRLKRWISFLQKTKYVKRKMIFNLNDLLNLDLNKKYAIDYQVFLIKSIEIELSNSKNLIQSPADVEFAQIN